MIGADRTISGARFAAVLILALSVAVASAARAQAVAKTDGEHRVALVIGNGDYVSAGKLANPVNDARAMSAKLAKLGFDVISVENGTQKQMQRAVGQFSGKLGADAVSLFFYAGHGMQVNGRNYLIPVDAEITTEQTVRLETVDVDAVIEQMSMAKSRVNLVILDACRNNPFERRFRGVSGGLASVEAPKGTLIAYATSPGKVAADGDSGNGLYTAELLSAIEVPGSKVEDVFKQVRRRVAAKSGDAQTPWESSSLTGDFYFAGSAPASVASPATPPSAVGAPVDREVVFWTSVKDTGNAALIQTYLDQYPQGTFAGAAKVLIDQLNKGQLASVTPKVDLGRTSEGAGAIEEVEGAYITVKRANVRERAEANAKLIKALEPGTLLTVTGHVKNTEWYRATTADNKVVGFVFGDAIKDIQVAEEEEWQRVKGAKQSAVVSAFLRRYPAGAYAAQAKLLHDDLAKNEKAIENARRRDNDQQRVADEEARARRLEQERAEQERRAAQAQADAQRREAQARADREAAEARAQAQREDAVRNQMFNTFQTILGTIPRR